LVATWVTGIVGITERTANASNREGVAMKFANVAAAS
jgi:hypothetical protein